MRKILIFALTLLTSPAALTQENSDVRVQLSLANGKSSCRSGEPIILELAFSSSSPGYRIDTVTTELASPVDRILLFPTTGVYPWLDDYSRGHRYSPDYATSNEIQPGQPVMVRLPLNALYRFDKPGHYTVRVATSRVSQGEFMRQQPAGALTSNDVSFDVTPMNETDEAADAARLEALIRSAPNLRTAQRYAEQLQWLAGDPSTRVKLSLFLHPKVFYPFGVDVSRGLWVARNRALVVSALEQAMSDPEQSIDAMLLLAVALKSRLASPYDPTSPTQPVQGKQIEDDYLRRVAATLPLRQGDSLTTTAITLLTRLVQRGDTSTQEFQAVREAIITHFAEVNEYKVDWVLNSFGKYLEDPRMIPALEDLLGKLSTPKFATTRAAILKQLNRLQASYLMPLVIAEVCDPKSLADFNVLSAMPFDSLTEADACLLDQIRQYASGDVRQQIVLQHKSALAARFATAGIYEDLFALYLQYEKTWTGGVRGGMLAYLARYDGTRSRPLLDAALPADAPNFDPNITFALFRAYYSPALGNFLRTRLESAPPGQASEAAYAMSAHGTAEDQAILRKRLDRWNAQWAGHESDLPPEQAALQSELIQAVIRGKYWQVSEAEASALRDTCLSDLCRSRLRVKR